MYDCTKFYKPIETLQDARDFLLFLQTHTEENGEYFVVFIHSFGESNSKMIWWNHDKQMLYQCEYHPTSINNIETPIDNPLAWILSLRDFINNSIDHDLNCLYSIYA